VPLPGARSLFPVPAVTVVPLTYLTVLGQLIIVAVCPAARLRPWGLPMAKHKGQQALFDLLRKDCPEGQASAKPTPVIRRTVAAATPAPISAPKPVEAPRPEPAFCCAR
jgi:hypothetical protein